MTSRASAPRSALVDAGATLALANGHDRNHDAAVRMQAALVAAGTRLYSTNYFVDETYTLILARMGYRFAVMERLDINAAFTFDANFTEYGRIWLLDATPARPGGDTVGGSGGSNGYGRQPRAVVTCDVQSDLASHYAATPAWLGLATAERLLCIRGARPDGEPERLRSPFIGCFKHLPVRRA